jgi:hypothetical protein
MGALTLAVGIAVTAIWHHHGAKLG